MDDQRWQVYRGLGLMFAGIGAGGLVVSIAEQLLKFRFFSSSAVAMSLLLLFIGLGLLQTVRQGRREAQERRLQERSLQEREAPRDNR